MKPRKDPELVRSVTLQTKVTNAEANAISQHCIRGRMTLSNWLRRLALRALKLNSDENNDLQNH
jgi:hypothetical protein